MLNEATPAATIILLRGAADGLEIFMVERSRSMSFAGGAMVFPGGKVDVQDAAVARDAAPGLPDGAARVAAIRETFEEAGVLLTEGPAIDPETRARWRLRLTHHEADFGTFLQAVGHKIATDRLVPFARWLPPVNIRRRFDTLFYLAAMPADQIAVHDGYETTRSQWLTPREAMRLADAGAHDLMFPTRRNIERVALHDTLDALFENARALPVRRIQPYIEQRGGADWLCIPDDCGYPVTAELAAKVTRG